MKKNSSSRIVSQKTHSSNFLDGSVPISVNIPITGKCNYRCRFCFAESYLLDDSRILESPKVLADAGTQKISFEGGEPFLYPKLGELLKISKEVGLVTSVISNGSLITKEILTKLSQHLDWLTLSIDSPDEGIELKLGRGFGGHVKQVRKVVGWAHDLGVKLKLNVVVTKLNINDDLSDILLELQPERVKLLQVLPIEGVNASKIKDLLITEEEFMSFVERHLHLKDKGISLIHETNDDMTGSYIMVLPDGRLFNNNDHRYQYSKYTIFDDIEKALEEVKWNVGKFEKRGGLYAW